MGPAGFMAPTRLRRVGALTVGAAGATLLLTLAQGIVLARGLGTTGRGQYAAILALAMTVTWLAELGCTEAAAFHQAREPALGSHLLGAWTLILVVTGLIAVLAAEALIGPLLHGQSSGVQLAG